MRVALLSYNAQAHNAIGNLVADKVRFFRASGAEVRLFVEDARGLHPDLQGCCVEVPQVSATGPSWEYLSQADLVLAVYGQYYELLQFLPCLAGGPGRIVLEYVGVTPPDMWPDQHREGLQTSQQQRGQAWCADRVLTISEFSRRELLDATHFPPEHVKVLPPCVDLDRFRAGPRERFLQERLGIAGRLLLYVGRLAGNKRVPLLIAALARLNDPALHVVLIGDVGDVYAEEARRCCALAHQLRVLDRVHLLGQLPDADLPRAYRSADVLIVPSLHEGFCVPVIEAMACGAPVVASRSAALPETIGDAGLTFTPNDADDLASQLRRVLANNVGRITNPSYKRIAIVCFRFGPDIVGGAETSLRTMARALQAAGEHVEVFTTCTVSECRWQNDLPAGTAMLEGLPVHRFPIDVHDAPAHGEVYRQILDAGGQVSPEMEQAYVRSSLHSTSLLDALRARRTEFDAIITGPYLFGLTADVARAFPGQTLLVPCFHDEALARLALWPRLFGELGGILYHSAEEQHFAQAHLGVNHPSAWEIGALLGQDRSPAPASPSKKPYVVYCGRYSEGKNLPLLLDWARRYQNENADRFDFVFMGKGDVALPNEPWLRDLGRVEEAQKRSVLAGAKALIQLSRHESLSLVVLEAWAEQTPVIVHRECAVLAAQNERAGGGVAIADYAEFAGALDDLWRNEGRWRERGANGQAFVAERYTSSGDYVARIVSAIERTRMPLAEQMRERGLQRARRFARPAWQTQFAEFIDNTLTQPARPYHPQLRIEALRPECRVRPDTRTVLIPVRLCNVGTHAAVPAGPGRTVLCWEVRRGDSQHAIVARREVALPALLLPGQMQVAAVPVTVPHEAGTYRLLLWPETTSKFAPVPEAAPIALSLIVAAETDGAAPAGAAVFLEAVQESLPKAQQLQQLPSNYVDVTEGRFAPAKRFVKQKLLNNFKRGYVDVLSRQQSQVNGQVVLMIQQLAECCAMLDHAVDSLHQRLDALETKLEQAAGTTEWGSGSSLMESTLEAGSPS